MVNITHVYFSSSWLISSCNRGFTNEFDIPLKHFEVLEGFVKDYFCSNYSELDFGKRGMKGLTMWIMVL